MPTLTLRAVGRSFLVEGLPASGLDGARLHRAMDAAYGPAVAVIASAGAAGPIEALIVDRKADSWDGLRDHLARWVREQGYSDTTWFDADPARGPSATIRFGGA